MVALAYNRAHLKSSPPLYWCRLGERDFDEHLVALVRIDGNPPRALVRRLGDGRLFRLPVAAPLREDTGAFAEG